MSKNDPIVDAEMLDNIRDLNLSYLMIAQQLLKKNRSRGMFTLGLTEDAAQTLLMLRPAQIVKLANNASLLCSFRLNDAELLSALSLDQEASAARDKQRQHHISMLLAQRTAMGIMAESTAFGNKP